MKLYYSPGACSLATHIVLEWIGKPYDRQRVSIHAPKSPELLAVNPAGAVPVLEEDGWVLTQNAAILSYLAEVFPEAKLDGDGTARGRAEVNRWLGMVNSDLHPAFKPLFGSTRYLEDNAMVGKTREHAKATVRGLLETVDARLADREWIAGPRSVADAYLFVMARWARGMKLDAGLSGLERFWGGMRADAAVKAVLAEEGLEG